MSPLPCGSSRPNLATGSRLTRAGRVSDNLHSAYWPREMTDPQPVHAPPVTDAAPLGDLCIRTLAMPADTNQNGDIFGGWLLSQMDVGGGVFASKIAKCRTVTVAIE